MASKRGKGGLVGLDVVRKFAYAARAKEPRGRHAIDSAFAGGADLVSADGYCIHVARFADEAARRECEPAEGLIPRDGKRVSDGEFFDYESQLTGWPGGDWLRMRIDRAALLRAVKIAYVFGRDNNHSVRLSFTSPAAAGEPGELLVSGRSAEFGDAETLVDTTMGADAWRVLTTAANGKFLIRALSGMQSAEVTLALLGENDPFILADTVQTAVGAVDLLTLIMPMTVTGRESRPAAAQEEVIAAAAEAESSADVDYVARARALGALYGRLCMERDSDAFRSGVYVESALHAARIERVSRLYDGLRERVRLSPHVYQFHDVQNAFNVAMHAANITPERVPAVTADPDPLGDFLEAAARIAPAADVSTVQAADPAPAVVDNAPADPPGDSAPARAWRKHSARMLGRGRAARKLRPAAAPAVREAAPADPDRVEDVCEAAPAINGPTLAPAADPAPDLEAALNALTFDQLCGALADRLATAAIGRVNARLVEVGREMHAARAWAIASIREAAQAQAVDVAGADFLPINADTFGPDWSEWGAFWEDAPAPDLEDTQPMPPVAADDDPDDDPPAPDGGGSVNAAQSEERPLSEVGLVFRREADPYGRPAWYAYRADDGTPLYVGGRTVDELQARCANYGRFTLDRGSADELSFALEDGWYVLYTFGADGERVELTRSQDSAALALWAFNHCPHSERIAREYADPDQAANVCPAPAGAVVNAAVNTPTFAETEKSMRMDNSPEGVGGETAAPVAPVVGFQAGRLVVCWSDGGRNARALPPARWSIYRWPDANRLILGRNAHGLIFAREWVYADGSRFFTQSAGSVRLGKRDVRMLRVLGMRGEDLISIEDVTPLADARALLLRGRGRIGRADQGKDVSPIKAETFGLMARYRVAARLERRAIEAFANGDRMAFESLMLRMDRADLNVNRHNPNCVLSEPPYRAAYGEYFADLGLLRPEDVTEEMYQNMDPRASNASDRRHPALLEMARGYRTARDLSEDIAMMERAGAPVERIAEKRAALYRARWWVGMRIASSQVLRSAALAVFDLLDILEMHTREVCAWHTAALNATDKATAKLAYAEYVTRVRYGVLLEHELDTAVRHATSKWGLSHIPSGYKPAWDSWYRAGVWSHTDGSLRRELIIRWGRCFKKDDTEGYARASYRKQSQIRSRIQ